MKTKVRFLTLILFAAFVSIVSCSSGNNTENSADNSKEDAEYTAILKELMTNETVAEAMNLNMKESKDILVEMLTSRGVEQSEAEETVNTFINDILVDINIKYFLPYCKKYLTLDELKKVRELYNNAEYQRVNRQSLVANKNNMYYIESALSQAMNCILANVTPEPVERRIGYSDSYLALCNEYCKATHADAIVDNIIPQLAMAMGNNNESKRVANSLASYMKDNFDILLANMMYGSLNEEEIKTLISYTKKSEMQKFLKANMERSKNMDAYLNEVNAKYQEFIEKNLN